MQAPAMGMAPPIDPNPTTSDAPKTEEGKTNSFASSGFKLDSLKVKEFVPAGQVALTEEQFPDLLTELGSEPKKGKGKKGKKGVVADNKPKPVVEEFDESMPWKGRKSEFFVMQQAPNPPAAYDQMNPMNYELNDGQWDFIFKYYPEYAASPFQMMSYLFAQALESEQQYSGKPTLGGR